MTADALQNPVTARWAEALFHAAARAGAVDEVLNDAQRLSREVATPSVHAFLFGGGVGHGERVAKLGPLLETLHPLMRNFVRLLFDRRRQEVLIGIGDAFKQRFLESQGAVEGIVESAHSLDEAQVASIADTIGRQLGKTVHLTSTTNPELVAGIRVLVGARMLDYSVKGRLAGLRQRLLDAPLPALTS